MTLRGRRGFSLLEVMIATAIVGFLAAMLYLVLSSSGSTYANMNRLGDAQERARRVMDEMARELRLADQTTMLIPVSKDSVKFNIPVSYDSTTKLVTWSTQIEYKLELVPTQYDDAAKGLVHYRLIRTQDVPPPAADSVRLTDYIKTGGLVFTKTGDNLVINLTFLSLDEKNKKIETTLQSSVTLRNSQ